jgi:hypothetical protein
MPWPTALPRVPWPAVFMAGAPGRLSLLRPSWPLGSSFVCTKFCSHPPGGRRRCSTRSNSGRTWTASTATAAHLAAIRARVHSRAHRKRRAWNDGPDGFALLGGESRRRARPEKMEKTDLPHELELHISSTSCAPGAQSNKPSTIQWRTKCKSRPVYRT